MKISPLPILFLIFLLPTWPIKAPSLERYHPSQLPAKALELIPGVGPKLSQQLHQVGPWQNKPGIGPKTRQKLLTYLKP